MDGLPSSRSQRWEPREIRGRLRHCDGLQSPKATGSARTGKAGARSETRKSGHQSWLYARRVPPSRGHFSVKEKDEASPLELFFSGLVNAFILRFAGA